MAFPIRGFSALRVTRSTLGTFKRSLRCSSSSKNRKKPIGFEKLTKISTSLVSCASFRAKEPKMPISLTLYSFLSESLLRARVFFRSSMLLITHPISKIGTISARSWLKYQHVVNISIERIACAVWASFRLPPKS